MNSGLGQMRGNGVQVVAKVGIGVGKEKE